MIEQPRLLLSLDQTTQTHQARQHLKSPLGLAHDIIRYLFDNRFDELRDKLDIIKQFVAGVGRVERLSDYALATYYPTFFAYHQFFHSSYRARQGNVLENLMMSWIATSSQALVVPHAKKEMRDLMKRVLPQYASRLDLDVVVANDNRLLCVQLRSRDDTGGTVAKMSLGEVARYMLRVPDIAPNSHIFYVIGIWDARQHTQETITKSKLYEVLKDDITQTKEQFMAQLTTGIALRPHLTMQLAYGYTELARVIADWAGGLDASVLAQQMDFISQADDMWLAYLVGHLELESQQLYGQNNIVMLEDVLSWQSYDTQGFQTSAAYVALAGELAQKIAPAWQGDFPFLHTLREKMTYIRDLILLKFIYDNLS